MKSDRKCKGVTAIFVAIIMMLSVFALALSANVALAQDPVTLSGTVRDNQASPFAGADVRAIDPATQEIVASDITDASGEYSMSLSPGTYDVQVVPPSGSGFQTAIAPGQSITTDMVLDFVLVPPSGVAILSGKVLDALGQGVPSQTVCIAPWGTSTGTTSITDSSGSYYLEVAPGTYKLQVNGYNPDPSIYAVPSGYSTNSRVSISLTGSMILDLPLPAKRVNVRVQNPEGTPVPDVVISTNSARSDFIYLGDIFASGYSRYSTTTDASGDATLWLFPIPSGAGFTFTATPPAESPFVTFNIQDVEVVSDMTIIVILEFIHAPPVTTASISPEPDEQGIYHEPVTVTLSATAFEGFTIVATYYNVDGGAAQDYTGPFVIAEGTQTLEYWSEDDAGVYETPKTLTIEILSNQPPVANANGPYPGDEGSPITFDGSGSTDPDGDALQYRWDFNNDGIWDTGWSTEPTANHAWGDDFSGTVIVEVSDGTLTDTSTCSVTVSNVASVADAGEDKAGDEPSTFTFTGTHTDPGTLDTQTYEWDFDYDGMTFDVDATGNGVTNTWDDDNEGTVALRVTDDDGGWSIDTCSVIVRNVAPTITSLTGLVDPAEVNSAVSLTGEFTDPGLDDTHTATFDWDDTTSTDYVLINGEREVTGTHTYTEAGVYTVTLTVEDDDGGVDSETFQYVVVYDPDGGFVTGGGWINSPEGAYTADPTLTGKASFGFVSKYKKGATTPTGNTEFQFKASDLNFHSRDYDWLVIAGHKAMYKGTGTINGAGNYGFMISAIDEALTPSTGVDMFRIKIGDKDNGDAVVYDNQLGEDEDADPKTEIQGGSIVIHRGK